MLTITLEPCEMFDERKNEFVYCREENFKLEHSLLSLSKWESKWHKPFLSKEQMPKTEMFDYIRCMCIGTEMTELQLYRIGVKELERIRAYIDDPMTATWFNERGSKGFSRKTVTAELIYYWMIALNIPFECEKWHLNRLMTLIRVCDIEQQPKKKMSQSEIMRQNAALNAARRAKLRSKG